MAEEAKASTGESAAKRVFVITPLGASGSPERLHADWVLNAAIKPVFEGRGYEVFRSDTIADPAMINDAIFNHVTDDEVCIADLSFLNPNVFYELGVRHALVKPVIHIAHDSIRIPFDTAQHRAIFFSLSDYHSIESLKKQLEEQLDSIESGEFKVSNPLTHAMGRTNLSNSGDERDVLIADLIGRIDRIESQIRYDRWMLAPDKQEVYEFNEKLPLNISSRILQQRNTQAGAISHLAKSITQFMVERHDAPRDEILADFPREFGMYLSDMRSIEKNQLYGLIMDPPGADGMIDGDFLRELIYVN